MPVSGLSNCEVTQAGGRGGMMKYCGDYCLFPVSRLTVSVSFFQPWPGHSPTITTYYCNHDDEAKLYPKPRCFPNIIDLFGAKSWSFVPKPNPMCAVVTSLNVFFFSVHVLSVFLFHCFVFLTLFDPSLLHVCAFWHFIFLSLPLFSSFFISFGPFFFYYVIFFVSNFPLSFLYAFYCLFLMFS